MKDINRIVFRDGSKEELLPDFDPDFPHISSHLAFDRHLNGFVPWHWHKEAELFYIAAGVLEYYTPMGRTVFPAGSGGFINTNVLHMTRPQDGVRGTTQFVHLFDSTLISGQQGNRIEQKYVAPLTTAPQVEVVSFSPNLVEHEETLVVLRASFQLSAEDPGYELKLRAMLSSVWLQVLEVSTPLRSAGGIYDKTNDAIKQMMAYIHEHYPEKLTIAEIAAAAFISERECFRAFQSCLHTTPASYLNGYRLQKACQLLASGRGSVTEISHSCGLGSSSYFGKVFHNQFGCTPLEYRAKWQDYDINRHK